PFPRLPVNESAPSPDPPRSARRVPPLALEAGQLPDKGGRLGGGSAVQLLMKQALQLAILLQRVRRAVREVEADQVSVRRLAQGVDGHGAQAVLEGLIEVAGLLVVADELAQGALARLGEALSLAEQPVLVVSRQQISLVERHGAGERL